MRMRVGYAPAQQFLRKVRESALVRRVFVPEAWETEAESLLQQYADQDFSYVDATSFVAMRRLRISEAFTFDHHFLVAGFALVAD
jgi:predicted nucleic acid-binding protein